MCCLIGAGSQTAQAQIYLNDTTVSNFTGPITSYATFSNYTGFDAGAAPPYTPTSATVASGLRVFGGTLAGTGLSTLNGNNWIKATFSSPVSTIVVFPNIDHFGSFYDGFQYSIAGSNDGVTWTMLYDATGVSNAGEPFTLTAHTGTAPLFVNHVIPPCTLGFPVGGGGCLDAVKSPGSGPNGSVGYEAFFDFGTPYTFFAFGASTVASTPAVGNTPTNVDQEFSAVGTGPAAITQTLLGNGADNSFQFGFARYDVIYPLDVTIAANTTMTISPNVLAPSDCNSAINIPAFSAGEPTCTTFPATSPANFSVIFDLACSVNGAASTSAQCPTTTGFNPFTATGFHSSEDIINSISYSSPINLTFNTVAPQMLTAPEGSNAWVAFGTGFTDCISPCSRGGGGSNYNSTVVSADFPGGSAFTIPAYTVTPFEPPVALPPAINVAQAGSNVPTKFCVNYPVAPSLGYNGGQDTTLMLPPVGYFEITATPISTSTTSTTVDNPIPLDTSTTAGLLPLGMGCYNFVLKTPKTLAGQTFKIIVVVGDGNQTHFYNLMLVK